MLLCRQTVHAVTAAAAAASSSSSRSSSIGEDPQSCALGTRMHSEGPCQSTAPQHNGLRASCQPLPSLHTAAPAAGARGAASQLGSSPANIPQTDGAGDDASLPGSTPVRQQGVPAPADSAIEAPAEAPSLATTDLGAEQQATAGAADKTVPGAPSLAAADPAAETVTPQGSEPAAGLSCEQQAAAPAAPDSSQAAPPQQAATDAELLSPLSGSDPALPDSAPAQAVADSALPAAQPASNATVGFLMQRKRAAPAEAVPLGVHRLQH